MVSIPTGDDEGLLISSSTREILGLIQDIGFRERERVSIWIWYNHLLLIALQDIHRLSEPSGALQPSKMFLKVSFPADLHTNVLNVGRNIKQSKYV